MVINSKKHTVMNKKEVTAVYETYDYDAFRIMEKGNRDIDHFGHISKSMKENFLFSPILVNEKMEIIDGQNRFIAAKSLNKPIYYIVKEGYGINEVRILNSNSKNWKKKDFVKSYADEGREVYVMFAQFLKDFPDFPASVAENILKMTSGGEKGQNRSLINGRFVIPDIEKSYSIARTILRFKPFCDDAKYPIYKRNVFVCAIVRLVRSPDFDIDLIIKKIQLNPRAFVPCVTSNEYIKMIEDIVNFRNRNKIRFNV